MRTKIVFLVALVIFIGALVRIDRVFFKRGSGFNVRFLYSCLPPDPKWDLPPPSLDQDKLLDVIVKQKFHYLAQGIHCFAFVSEDQKYVIKFHKYPSHMRLFPWLTHPFSYHFNERRKKIRQYNFQRLSVNFTSYKDSYQHLQEETGILLVHINPTHHLCKKITLVDKTKGEYKIPLDDVTFVLQKRADLIYPTLDRLVRERKLEDAKHTVSNIIQLITICCQKGYVDDDPVLYRNYGLLADRAIHIDVGDLIKNENVMLKENYIPHVKEMTASLRTQLESDYPELLEHYDQEIEHLNNF